MVQLHHDTAAITTPSAKAHTVQTPGTPGCRPRPEHGFAQGVLWLARLCRRPHHPPEGINRHATQPQKVYASVLILIAVNLINTPARSCFLDQKQHNAAVLITPTPCQGNVSLQWWLKSSPPPDLDHPRLRCGRCGVKEYFQRVLVCTVLVQQTVRAPC